MKIRSFLRIAGSCMLIFVGMNLLAQDNSRTVGMASSYSSSDEGTQTANGETYQSGLYTGCHASLPFGTVVRVTNLRTNKSVLVRINDRFDFKTNRLIDVSNAAARELELFDNVAPLVSIEVVEWPTEESSTEGSGDNEG